MAWKIELSPRAQRDLLDLDHQTAVRIAKFLKLRVANLADPRSIGEALRGKDYGDYWKYRIGDYRAIADIKDKLITIIVLRVGSRREVYRR